MCSVDRIYDNDSAAGRSADNGSKGNDGVLIDRLSDHWLDLYFGIDEELKSYTRKDGRGSKEY